jgi:hypothetical protein
MRRVGHAGHLISSAHRRTGSEIDENAVARHQTVRPGGADDNVRPGLRVAADGQFRQQATAGALDQIRGGDGEMRRQSRWHLEQSVRRAAGGEDQINRIAHGKPLPEMSAVMTPLVWA